MSLNHNRFVALYARERPAMREALARLRRLLREVVGNLEDKNLVRARLVRMRIKRPESLRRKAEAKGWKSDEAITYAGDLIGARVVCSNLDDVARFAELLGEAVRSIADEPIEVQNYIRNPQPSGYRAIHFNFRLDVGKLLYTRRFGCEVQIRTVLQNSWGDLSHEDIYKNDESLPEDLRARARDLSRILEGADEIAQSIRDRVGALRPAPTTRPALDSVTEDGLVFIFASVFGRSPKDYTVREALDACREGKLTTLLGVAIKIRDEALRERLRKAYATETRWQLENDKLLGLCVIAATKGNKRAVRAARELGRRAWREIDDQWRREVISELPEDIDDLLSALENDDFNFESLANALGAADECAVCGTTTIDVYAFEEAISERYGKDLEGKVVDVLLSSAAETGMAGDPSLCAYHADQFAKDD
jgi:ppGpp synthetase/RelA/SpoT-type nucleotidyltranferase